MNFRYGKWGREMIDGKKGSWDILLERGWGQRTKAWFGGGGGGLRRGLDKKFGNGGIKKEEEEEENPYRLEFFRWIDIDTQIDRYKRTEIDRYWDTGVCA